MKNLKIKEIICLVLFAAFIVLIMSVRTGSDKSAEELAQAALAVVDDAGMTQQGNDRIKTCFGLNANDYESVAYYSCDDIMNVNEVFVVKLYSDSQANDVIIAAETHIKKQINIFSGYGEEQSELLGSCVLEHTGNCVFLIVSASSQDAGDAVLSSR